MDSFRKTKPISWPDKAGYWWFWGKKYENSESELLAVSVIDRGDGKGVMMVLLLGYRLCGGYFDSAQFIPATLPELPEGE